MYNLPISRDAFFWAFSITCQLHRVPLKANVIMQRHEPPFTLGSFREAANQDGLKVRQRTFPRSQIGHMPVPCLVTLHPPVQGSVVANGDVASALQGKFQLALLEHMDERWVTVVEACGSSTTIMSLDVFAQRFTGEAVLISPRDAQSSDQHHGPGTNSDQPGKPLRGIAALVDRRRKFASLFPGIHRLLG